MGTKKNQEAESKGDRREKEQRMGDRNITKKGIWIRK
jgi:hypothetical protein